MKLHMALIADCANITADGKLNVMGVFDRINAYHFPARQPSMTIVFILDLELGEYNQEREMAIKLLDPDGRQTISISKKIQTPEQSVASKPRLQIIIDLRDVPFQKPGPYNFVIMIDKDHKGEIPIFLNKIEPPTPQ